MANTKAASGDTTPRDEVEMAAKAVVDCAKANRASNKAVRAAIAKFVREPEPP